VTKVETIEKRFDVQADQQTKHDYIPNVNVGAGQKGLVITGDEPRQLQLMHFGFTPSWSKKRTYVLNARAEGDRNKDNDPLYTGSREIYKKPFFRKAMKSQRCLVIADAFIEGPQKEKLSKPYVVYLRDNQRPFAFAGLHEQWLDTTTGELIDGYAIITTVSNGVTQAIGHHRSPVILPQEQEKAWLDYNATTAELLGMLDPTPAHLMNAYPIAADIKSPCAQGIELLTPMGQRLFSEHETHIYEELHLLGMGMTTGRRIKLDNTRSTDTGIQGTLF